MQGCMTTASSVVCKKKRFDRHDWADGRSSQSARHPPSVYVWRTRSGGAVLDMTRRIAASLLPASQESPGRKARILERQSGHTVSTSRVLRHQTSFEASGCECSTGS
jgi:hypothetical protein